MGYDLFSWNGEILPINKAAIELSNVEYAYGYGVYENIRFASGNIYFLDEHIGRLLTSANIISIEHNFSAKFINNSVKNLIKAICPPACNIKILLIGGRDAVSARLYVMCLNPLFPDRKLYKLGARCITEHCERPFPQAKSLNMLPSYLAYKKARVSKAYDALLVDRNGNITEGTRTNFFTMNDKTIYSPPADKILHGVTRDKVLRVAKENDYKIVEKQIALRELASYDGAFLTSTSSKIMPIKSIDEKNFLISTDLKKLIKLFGDYLDIFVK